jgi:hypothetical protein
VESGEQQTKAVATSGAVQGAPNSSSNTKEVWRESAAFELSFRLLEVRYPELKGVPRAQLDSVGKALDEDEELETAFKLGTIRSMLLVSLAFAAFVVGPFSTWSHSELHLFTDMIWSDHASSLGLIWALTLAIILVFCFVWICTFIWGANRSPKKLWLRILLVIPEHPAARTRVSNVLFFIWTLVVFLAGSLWLLGDFWEPARFVVEWIWLICVWVIAWVLVLAICIVAMVLFFVRWNEQRPGFNNRARLVNELTGVLLELGGPPLSDKESLILLSNSAKRVVAKIVESSKLVKGLATVRGDSSSEWVNSQLRLASMNLLRLASLAELPRSDSPGTLQKEILHYLIHAIKGSFGEFPTSSLESLDGLIPPKAEPGPLSRLVSYTTLAVYLALPVILFFIATLKFHLDVRVAEPVQVALWLLYGVWTLIGLLAFSKHISPDARELLAALIRLPLKKE